MKKLLNFRVSVFIFLSICLGIVAVFFAFVKNSAIGYFIFGAFVIFLVVNIFVPFMIKCRGKAIVFCVVALFFFLVSGLNFYFGIKKYDEAALEGHYYEASGRIKEIYAYDGGQKLIIENLNVSGNFVGSLDYKIAVYAQGEGDFDVGDYLSFFSPFYDYGLFYEGRFSSYNIIKGIRYYTYCDVSDLTVTDNSKTVFEKVNIFMRDVLKNNMDENAFSVAYAMLTGNSDFMDGEILSDFRNAGIAHIFAVSGLHIGVLYAALDFLFRKLHANKYVKIFCIIPFLFCYSGICGFSPSSVRAAVMCSVFAVARLGGARYDPLSSVGTAGLLILLFAPFQIFSVGFQLSFAVVTGIILLASPLSRLFKFLPDKVSGAIGTVLAAQISAFPVCVASFNSFSLVAVMANIVFMPIMSALFVLTLICTLIAGTGLVPAIILFVPNIVLKGIIFLIGVFDTNIFLVSGFTLGATALFYYCTLLIVSGIINVKRTLKVALAVAFSLIFVTGTVFVNVENNKGTNVIFLGSQKICATFVSDSGGNALIVSDYSYGLSVNRLMRIKNNDKIGTIDSVILMNGESNEDAQLFLTRLLTVYKVGQIICYGEIDADVKTAITASFADIDVGERYDGDPIIVGNRTYEFVLNGKLVKFLAEGRKVGVFAGFGSNHAAYSGAEGEAFYMLAAKDYSENIFALYKPVVAVSYRYDVRFTDAESGGNLYFKLK